MSLADRLAAAQRERGVSGPDGAGADGFTAAAPRARRSVDPFGDLKRAVHQTLLDNLGPKLYDSRLTQAELEQRVRQTLAGGDRPGRDPAVGRRPRPDRPGDRRRHPRLRAARALPAGRRHHRGHGQRVRLDLHRAGRADPPGRRDVHRRSAPAPHDRQDRGAGGTSGRRGQPDGRRPTARRQPGQRHHPAAGDRRFPADRPQVLLRPLPGRGPDRLRHDDPRRRPTSSSAACAASSTSW